MTRARVHGAALKRGAGNARPSLPTGELLLQKRQPPLVLRLEVASQKGHGSELVTDVIALLRLDRFQVRTLLRFQLADQFGGEPL